MPMIELTHIYLVIPKIIELILFLVAILTASEQFHETPWKERPQLHKLLVLGLSGWIIFVSLDLFIFLMAGLSFNETVPYNFYSGYSKEYPSLLIANILRDISALGLLLLLACYIIIPFTLQYGEDWTSKNILQNKLIKIIYVAFTFLLLIGETISADVSSQGIILDETWTNLSGISILIFILLYMISAIRIAAYLKSSSSNFITSSSKRQVKYLQRGILSIGFGFLFIFIMGMLKLIIPALNESPLIRFLIHFFGHCFWIVSPIFITIGIRIPLEKLNPFTERKHLAQQMKETEARYQDIFLNTNDVIVQADTLGVITDVNPATLELLGYTKTEMIGHEIAEFTDPDFADQAQLQWGQILQTQQNKLLFELLIVKKNGMRITLETNSTFFFADGVISRVSSICRDITERKDLENRLQKAQKLESIALLAGGIAHDYNNILVSILGNINLLQLQPHFTDEAQELLQDLESATLHASSLTDQLLTFSKGGAPIKNPTSIDAIVRDSAAFVLSGSNCDWTFNSKVDPLPQVHIDANQINRVLNNIIINAIQAMPDGGYVNINADIHVQEERNSLELLPGKYLQLSITDSGKGISSEYHDRMFEPYFTTKVNGSGLGLATCYSILKKHDGLITFTSKIGEGSTFVLYLPVATTKIISQAKTAIASPLRKAKILVMDDNRDIQKVLGRMLSKLDMEVDIVEDGLAAIKNYQEMFEKNQPYDLLIMDLTIPGGMGGKDAIQEIFTLDPSVKAIVSSGFSDDVTLANFKEHHFIEILPKPYSLVKLKEILAKVL